MSNFYFILALLVLSLIGYYMARLHKHARHRFSWFGFSALMLLPTGYVIMFFWLIGMKVVYLYLASAIVGFILEYLFGKAYFDVEDQKLWKYSKWNIEQYTSWLVLPIWGMVGVIFWSLGKFLGL